MNFIDVFAIVYHSESKRSPASTPIILDAFVFAWFYRYPEVARLWRKVDTVTQMEFCTVCTVFYSRS
jgi:hypothetical protein